MHVASLGEYEQGLPLLEKLKSTYPDHKLVLTFFSPSGYEVKKNKTVADIVTYLPMDTIARTKRFLTIVRPELAIFIKYEIWPNYLFELKKQKIPTLLVAALFSKRQVYFKFYGSFMRKSLQSFAHLFVQDHTSKQLLKTIGLDNVTISGDTRFDRVSEILTRDNTLDFMDTFCQGSICVVAGSTWPEDEEILIDFINSSEHAPKYVIAPHNIKTTHIEKLKTLFAPNAVCYSEIGKKDLAAYNVLIVDTIGLLTKIYSYADVAYVGGGFATGLHNTLEPAVFGIPVVIGPQYHGFKEAEDLVDRKGIIAIETEVGFKAIMDALLSDKDFRSGTGKTNADYIRGNTGATMVILKHIEQLL